MIEALKLKISPEKQRNRKGKQKADNKQTNNN